MIAAEMHSWCVQHKQTELFICADLPYEKEAADAIVTLRTQLDAYILAHPVFSESIVPVEPAEDAPAVVRAMCLAGKAANVGPMAAVAGAFAAYVGSILLKNSKQVIVENGGDIFIKTDKPKTVAVYAGKSPLSMKIGVVVDSREMPMSICTSSGTVGPSLSFGQADAAVVVAADACLADACATRLGNEVKSAHDIENALETIMSISGVTGAMAIVGDKCGAVGRIALETVTG